MPVWQPGVVLRLQGVRKRYRGGAEVLAGVDLRIDRGRAVVVLGANGSGKSTLLRVAAGAAVPTAGRVTGLPGVVGFVPGRVPASERMPVRAYLRHMAAIHGTHGRDALDLLERLGFSGELGGPVGELSSGNAQKVALAQALGCGASLLVLDEPWAALDIAARAELDSLLAAAVAGGAALLTADHTGHGAALPGAEVLRIDAGRLGPAPDTAASDAAASGTGASATARPAGVAGAIRSAAGRSTGSSGPGTGAPANRASSGSGSHAAAGMVIEIGVPSAIRGTVLDALPGVTRARWRGDTLVLLVPAGRHDALLREALAMGCSVLAVGAEGAARTDQPVSQRLRGGPTEGAR